MAGRQQRALDLDGLTEKYRTVNSLQEKERRQYLARKYRTSRREIKDLLCGQKENFFLQSNAGI